MQLDSLEGSEQLRFSHGELSVLYLESVKKVRQRVVCACTCGRQARVSLERWQGKPPRACGVCVRSGSKQGQNPDAVP